MPHPVPTNSREPIETSLPFHVEDLIRGFQGKAFRLASLIADKISASGDIDCNRLTQRAHPPWTPIVASAFLHGWGNFGSTYNAAGFKKEWTRVWLQGAIAGGTSGQSAFVLPANFRPLKICRIITNVNATTDVVDLTILPTGEVTPTVGSNTFVSLENVSFDTV